MRTAGATAGAAAAATERQFRFDDEAHIAYVDFNTADTFQKGRFEAEGKPVDFKRLVVFSRLIQSQCKARTASATGGEINTDAGLRPVSEEGLELGTSRFRKMDHCILQVYLFCMKIGMTLDFVKVKKRILEDFLEQPVELLNIQTILSK